MNTEDTINAYDLAALELLRTISACERRGVQLAEETRVNNDARNDAIVELVCTEQARRVALGLSPRGSATYVAGKINLTPERVSQILSAREVKTT